MPTPKPTDIILHRKSRTLDVAFDSGEHFTLPAEYLRVHSPSAEAHGSHSHAPSMAKSSVVAGKRDVGIMSVEPVGNYAVLLRFTDGHATGIYAWDTLHDLGVNQEKNWTAYLNALAEKSLSRDPTSLYGHPVPMRGPRKA